MRKAILIIFSVVILIMAYVGCGVQKESNKSNMPDINPNAQAANKDTAKVTLYFSYMGESLLAGETRTIDVPVNDKIEAAVIRELIAGPSSGRDDLKGLFWGNVKLANVDSTSASDILFVTLSSDFVSTSPKKVALEDGIEANQKKMAIYSIVDTIVQMGNYSKVQIQADRKGNKTGERITLSEAGWGGDTSTYLEPQAWNGDIVLTPAKTLTEALKSFQSKDWTRLHNFTAYKSQDGTVTPDSSSDALATQGNSLQSYNTKEAIVSDDGQTAVVLLDYTLSTRGGDTINRTDIPAKMIKENDVWKLSYTSLVNILINAG